MQNYRLILMLLLSGYTAYLDFKPIKSSTILFYDDFIFKWILLFVTFIFTLAWLQRNVQLYKLNRNLFYLSPSLVGIIVIIAVVGHNLWLNALRDRKTLYEAYNGDIGSDGGLTFQFKEGGYVFGKSIGRTYETYYCGKFHQDKDTILLDISLDFPLGRQAYIYNDSLLVFKDDTTKFNFYMISGNEN